MLCVCLTFPLCFAAARYIPPLRHHPIWFEEEWSEKKVHSWDPWNSEKYIDMDEFFRAAGGRMGKSVEQLFDYLLPALKARAQTTREAILPKEATGDFVLIRRTIYKYFWGELNWRGHKNNEVGLQLLPNYWVAHAHNIFLQFGIDFGIPVMILFIGMLAGALIICMKKWTDGGNPECMGSFLWLLIPLLFGMFEFCWGAGSLTIFMMFFSWRNVFWEEV